MIAIASHAVLTAVLFHLRTLLACCGPGVLGQLVSYLNYLWALMPSFQINLTDVILLIPFGILSPLATGFDHMVIANGNAMFKEFAFHAST
jgi:hypothetical protein